MAGHRNFKELRDGLADQVGEETLAAAEADGRADHARFEQRLGDVRKARNLTQVQLARALEVSQAQVSRIEGQTDLYLSTLASYIEAMGGRLELAAVFDDTAERVPLVIDDHEARPPVSSRAAIDVVGLSSLSAIGAGLPTAAKFGATVASASELGTSASAAFKSQSGAIKAARTAGSFVARTSGKRAKPRAKARPAKAGVRRKLN